MTLKPTRRDFIAGGVGAGMSLPLLSRLAPRWMHAAGGTWKKLVVVQLNGGNDMIQNLVDPDEPLYAAARPTLAMPKAKMEHLAGSLYLHPRLKAFKQLYDAGRLALLPGIGYPNPNLSHFRSMDIWAAADPAAANVPSGWLGDFLKKLYTGGASIEAIDVETRLNRHFIGHPVPVITPGALARYTFLTDASNASVDGLVEEQLLASNAKVLRPTASPNLKYISDAVVQAPIDSSVLTTTGSGYTAKATYPSATAQDRNLATSLQFVARYIVGGLTTPIYLVTLGGWDNHAAQVLAADNTTGTHANLLGSVADNVKAFLDDLAGHAVDDDVLVVIWSEFGRRVGENGALGTDHGAAGIAYLAGKPVKSGGIKSSYPVWSTAIPPYNRANFQFTVDFRRLYAEIIEKHWGSDSSVVLGTDQWRNQPLGIL